MSARSSRRIASRSRPRAPPPPSPSVVRRRKSRSAALSGLIDVLRGVPGLDIYRLRRSRARSTSSVLRGSTPGQTLRADRRRAHRRSVERRTARSISAASRHRYRADRGAARPAIGALRLRRHGRRHQHHHAQRRGQAARLRRSSKAAPMEPPIRAPAFRAAKAPLAYAFAIDALHIDGFPRYGYRITRPLTIGDGVTPLPPLPSDDPTNKGGASARLGYRFSEDLSVEGAFIGYDNRDPLRQSFAFTPTNVFDPSNHQHSSFAQGYVRVDADLFDHRLHNRLTLFGNVTIATSGRRALLGRIFYLFRLPARLSRRAARARISGRSEARRFGAPHLRRAQRDRVGAHVAGPGAGGTFTPIDAAQTTHSGFAQHQVHCARSLRPHLWRPHRRRRRQSHFRDMAHDRRLSPRGDRHEIPSASAGTGARVASLFQRFSQYGDPRLLPETSLGYDVGVDQKLFAERVFASVSLFDNRFPQSHRLWLVVELHGDAESLSAAITMSARAEMKGVEFSGEAVIVPDEWRVRGDLHASRRERSRQECSRSAAPARQRIGRRSSIPAFRGSSSRARLDRRRSPHHTTSSIRERVTLAVLCASGPLRRLQGRRSLLGLRAHREYRRCAL